MTGRTPSLVAPVSHRAVQAGRRIAYIAFRGLRELPTYFIVGAKRAGTTSLNEYVVDHPDALRGLVEKGSRFFDVNYERGPAWFNRTLIPRWQIDRLEQRTGVRPIYGESSPYYCFHPDSPSRIAQHVPNARLIFLLREPALRAWSHYRYEVARGFETLPFVEAVEAEAGRLGQRDATSREFSLRHHSYVARGQYASQLARLRQHFDPEQVLVIQSETLFGQPKDTMSRVFAHLGLRQYEGAAYKPFKENTRAGIPDEAARILDGRFDDSNAQLRETVGTTITWL